MLEAKVGYSEFRGERFFPELQSLRTLSVLLVLSGHMQDSLWREQNGAVGVTVFFVLSGFIITTLLLREEERTGKVSLRGFFIRRATRLLPLYYVVLAVFAVSSLVLHLGGPSDQAAFRHALPFYLTYQNDFAESAPFGQTWTLAIEEKFYVVWPLLAFTAVMVVRRRIGIALGLTAIGFASLVLSSLAGDPGAGNVGYLHLYLPILFGCVVALLMHSKTGFENLSLLRRPAINLLLIVLAVLVGAFQWWHFDGRNVILAIVVALTLPGLLTTDTVLSRAARAPLLVALGSYTYCVYLIHPLVKSGLDLAIASGQTELPATLARLAVVTVVSFGAAAIIYRLFEHPITEWGRRLSRKPVNKTPHESEPVRSPSNP